METKRVGIYCRVSTKDQNPENQLIDLRSYCKQRGWTIAGEFIDHGVSGTKEDRKQLAAIMQQAKKRKIDVVLVWRFDRFARSLRQLVNALSEFNSLGIDFVSYGDNIDTTSAQGKLHFHMVSAFSEFERELIRDRVLSGLQRARAEGTSLGRPRSTWDTATALKMRGQGLSIREIADLLKVPRSSVSRALSQKPPSKSGVALVEA